MRDERGPWYLLTGVILGIVVGLAYAWLVSPREYRDTSPASLREDFKEQYRVMIAFAFVANGNLPRARARLDQLGDEDVPRALAEQAQRTLAEGDDPRAAQALGLLAVALGQEVVTPPPTLEPTLDETPPTVEPTLTPSLTPAGTNPTPSNPGEDRETPTSATGASISPVASAQNATRTPLATGTPLPTRTPTATPGSPFVLQDQTFVCEQDIEGPLVQVVALADAAGNPLPGVEVVVSWEGGEDHFFTGLKPELGEGYADFLMTPGVVYTLRVAGGSEIISDLAAAECETSGGARYWGSWLLVFEQP